MEGGPGRSGRGREEERKEGAVMSHFVLLSGCLNSRNKTGKSTWWSTVLEWTLQAYDISNSRCILVYVNFIYLMILS
jgi:hypothetical protein